MENLEQKKKKKDMRHETWDMRHKVENSSWHLGKKRAHEQNTATSTAEEEERDGVGMCISLNTERKKL